jgi:hypothetical protein
LAATASILFSKARQMREAVLRSHLPATVASGPMSDN